jgi:hypothetical protein
MKSRYLFVLALGAATITPALALQALVTTRHWNGFPDSTVTVVNEAPRRLVIEDVNMQVQGGYWANQHFWQVSRDGVNPVILGIDDFFEFAFQVTLDSTSPVIPRKETGMRTFATPQGEGQFMVASNNWGAVPTPGEIAVFAGGLPFHHFGNIGHLGRRYTFRLRTFLDPTDNQRYAQYFVDAMDSGPKWFDNLENGIENVRLGGWLQGAGTAALPHDMKATWEKIRLRPWGTNVVSGTLSLEGFLGDITQQPIEVQLRAPGTHTVVEELFTFVNANGAYSFQTSQVGQFDVVFKAERHLADKVPNVTISTLPATGVNPSLLAGDVNDDNVVDLADFLILAANYEVTPLLDPRGDVNWDGACDLADFLLLAANYDAAGD